MREFSRTLKRAIADKYEQLTGLALYEETIAELQRRDDITPEQASALRARLPRQLQESNYILKHLGAHLGIGVVFAFDVVPLPLGTIGRISWVAGARLYETLKRNWSRARIHSIGVFLLAAVPWIGYAAYLLPLRKHARELNYLLTNHMMLGRRGMSVAAYVSARGGVARWIMDRLVPAPEALVNEQTDRE